jgi:hypothetical protein
VLTSTISYAPRGGRCDALLLPDARAAAPVIRRDAA